MMGGQYHHCESTLFRDAAEFRHWIFRGTFMSKRLQGLVAIAFIALLTIAPIGRSLAQTDAPTPNENSATIIGESEHRHKINRHMDRRILITRLDEKSLLKSRLSLVFGIVNYPEQITVAPGRHYIDVQYTYFNTYSNQKLWLDAEAGKTYIVKKKITGYSVQFWIEEADTGKVIGGIPGGEPDEEAEPKI